MKHIKINTEEFLYENDIKKIPISVRERLKEIIQFPNHGNDKGYTGSYHIDIPNKTLFHLNLENVIILCKLIVNIYGNINQWGNLPRGRTEDRVIETSDKYYIKLWEELKKETGQTTPLSLLKNIFVEVERFKLIERDMKSRRFRITKLGKEFAKAKIESENFSFDSANLMQTYIQNRFNTDPIWNDYIRNVDELVHIFKQVYWFDLWILSFSVGDNAKYELDYVIKLLADIRKWCGLTRGHDDSKLVSLNRNLIKEFTDLSNENKYDNVDIKQLSMVYNRMAELLDLSGRFTLIGNGQDLFLRHKNNRFLPKTIRRNKTYESAYNQKYLQKEKEKGVKYEIHHIIPHAKGKIYNGLNNDIENELNLIRISKEDHSFFENNPDTPFKIIDVVDKKVCFRSENNKKDIYFLKEQKLFNIDVIRSEFKPYNTKLLKKLKLK